MTLTTAKHNVWTWRCHACGKPIRGGTQPGFIRFTDPVTGGYPEWDEEREMAAQASYAAAVAAWRDKYPPLVSGTDLKSYPDFPRRALIQVFHEDPRCLGDRVERAYELDIRDDHDLLDTVAHLLGKHWFGAMEARILIRTYQNGLTADPGHTT